jgi:hypothetical protein
MSKATCVYHQPAYRSAYAGYACSELLRFLPLPRLKHLVPRVLHDLEPLSDNAGEFGDCVAAGLVVNEQVVADQAQRLHGMRGVPEGLLDVEQKRDQV